MSTRSTTHILGYQGETEAIIYRHSDGYPEGHGVDLRRFFADVEAQTQDTRYGDPSYLAAKLVVWLAHEFATSYVHKDQVGDRELADGEDGSGAYVWVKAPMLDFISVGIVRQDPGDIEYRYTIDTSTMDSDGRPVVKCFEVNGSEVEIPATETASR